MSKIFFDNLKIPQLDFYLESIPVRCRTNRKCLLVFEKVLLPEKPDLIIVVGNVMIDSLIQYLPKAEKWSILKDYSLTPSEYILVTLHPSVKCGFKIFPKRFNEIV